MSLEEFLAGLRMGALNRVNGLDAAPKPTIRARESDTQDSKSRHTNWFDARGAATLRSTTNLMLHEATTTPIIAADDDGDDLADWVEAPVLTLPPTDMARIEQTQALQERLSRHAPIDRRATWDDVDLDFP